MVLTAQQEEKMLNDYEYAIIRSVSRFCGKYPPSYAYYEDLLQEGRLAFLCYIRKAKDESTLKIFPRQSLLGSYCDFIRKQGLLHVPRMDKSFKETLKLGGKRANMDDLTIREIVFDTNAKDQYDRAEMNAVLEHFLESLSETEQLVLKLRLCGFQNCEIAEELNISRVRCTRILQRALEKYKLLCQ